MTLDELKDYLRKSGIKHFNVVTNLVGPDNEWTEAEQEEDCCQLVPDHDPCVEVGKTEPWNGWTEEEKQELGWYPKPGQTTPEELLANAEQKYGKGNVHLKIRETGPRPCGEKITRWSGSLSCCTSPTELVKFSGATTAEPDDVKTYRVLVGTGEPPITWHTIGAGVTVAKADATSARANFDDCFCKPVVIYAQDTCLSVAPWVVSRSDGSWASIDDESLSSPFGWYQDGTTGTFYITGFNDDNTKVSTQHYWQAEYVGTKEVVCGTTMPGINENPIVTPADGSQAFEKCESANIWVRLREGFSNVWEVRYAIDSQSTSEYTPGTCEDELEYDEENSVEEILADSSGVVFWTGGVAPFSVTLDGVEIYLDSGLTTTELYGVTAHEATIYTSVDACGTCYVSITDSCGVTVSNQFAIRIGAGHWEVMTGANDQPQEHRTIYTEYLNAFPDELCGWGSWSYAKTSEEITVVVGDMARSYLHTSVPVGNTSDYNYFYSSSRLSAYNAVGDLDDVTELKTLDPYWGVFTVLQILAITGGPYSYICSDNGYYLSYRQVSTINTAIYFHRWVC